MEISLICLKNKVKHRHIALANIDEALNILVVIAKLELQVSDLRLILNVFGDSRLSLFFFRPIDVNNWDICLLKVTVMCARFNIIRSVKFHIFNLVL